MGGRAFVATHGVASRFNTETASKFHSALSVLSRCYPVRELRCKVEYGDLDYVVSDSVDKNRFFYDVDYALQSVGYTYGSRSVNGNTHSVLYGGHQVDFVFVPESKLRFALNYYSDNDKGLLVGVTLSRLGFKFGYSGLQLRNYGGYEGYLTTDFAETLRFFAYSEKFVRCATNDGFNTYEELFEGVCSTPHFRPQYYNLESLNNENRHRNSKRQTYLNFLRYLETHGSNYSVVPPSEECVKQLQKSALLHFGHVVSYEEHCEHLREKKEATNALNGNVVQSLTGLSGKQLGYFMKYLKTTHPSVFSSAHKVPTEELHSNVRRLCFLYNSKIQESY